VQCIAPSWIFYATNAALVVSVVLLVIVMQATEHDRHHVKTDARWIKDWRRGSYIAACALACLAMLTGLSPISVLLIVVAADMLLLVTAMGLGNREYPGSGKFVAGATTFRHWHALRRTLASFRIMLRR
jgi:ABC-type xylose transport system permease subunit